MGRNADVERSTANLRDHWLALLEKNDVGHPRAFYFAEVPGGVVQATIGEPSGRMSLDAMPANVLMFNLSPVQALRQKREGREFVSDMLRGEMTLMPAGVPSEWSWNSRCDRLDIALFSDVLGNGSSFDIVDRFQFRDGRIATVCRRLYREVSLGALADRLHLEALVTELAVVLLRRHSHMSKVRENAGKSGLTRVQTRRVLEFIEAHLTSELTLRAMSSLVDLSPYHFARMFKQTMQTAPHRYLLDRRIEHAKTMLRANEASLLEISLSTGFCNQSHLTSTFHRMVGATPTDFQRSHQRLI